jgi:sigma54-dependent transcription regulator
MVARSDMAVLVVGETGAGKEIVTTAVHERSLRAKAPLVRVNCAALPEALLESELFGFEKGAFTGATHAKAGLIEAAHGGTFLLDEVGELPLPLQAKLLRVLESNEVVRLGGLKPKAVDVRFVAATNRHLPTLVASGAFRADLYYRLNGITGAARGVTEPGARLRGSRREGARSSGAGDLGRSHGDARGLRLARQRPTAQERGRAGGLAEPRRCGHGGRDRARRGWIAFLL